MNEEAKQNKKVDEVKEDSVELKDLSFEDIKDIKDSKSERILVAEWNGYITVGAMTLEERLRFEEKHFDPKTGSFSNIRSSNMIYDLLAISMLGPDGNKMFVNAEDPRVKDLANKSAKAVNRVFFTALHLNYLKEDAAELSRKK